MSELSFYDNLFERKINPMKFEIYESKSKVKSQRWWWRAVANNNKVTAGSVEGFGTPAKALRSIKTHVDTICAPECIVVYKNDKAYSSV